VDVKIIKRKGEDVDDDHVQFSITEKERVRRPSKKKQLKRTGSKRTSKVSSRNPSVDVTEEEDVTPQVIQEEEMSPAFPEEDDGNEGDEDEEDSLQEEAGLGLSSTDPSRDGFVSEEVAMLSLENKISPLTFCNAFPFHLVFDRNLHVKQVR